MKKLVSLIAALLALTLLLTACGGNISSSGAAVAESSSEAAAPEASSGTASSASEKEPVLPDSIKLLALKGPTGIGLANLDDARYTLTLASAPDEAVAAISSGTADIAALPTNLAANLYAKMGGGVQMIAISTYGSLYVLENGDTIHSVEDLRGKTIYATGQGSNPEYILNYVLEGNGLVVGEDVTVEYKSEHSELAALAASGEVAIAMLPEPNVTAAMVQNADLRIALDLTEEWDKIADSGTLVMGCFIVRREFAEQYPDAVADFLAKAEASINAALGDVDGTAQLCESLGIIPKAAIAKRAIPNCNLTFISGEDMLPAIEGYFKVLYDAKPASIGGAMPDEAFYYNAG